MAAFFECDVTDPVAALIRCIEQGSRALLMDRSALPDAFFDLSTGVAGELAQKLANYGVRMAGVVPDLAAHSVRFRARDVVEASNLLTFLDNWDQDLKP